MTTGKQQKYLKIFATLFFIKTQVHIYLCESCMIRKSAKKTFMNI